jgi:hypothetical protein
MSTRNDRAASGFNCTPFIPRDPVMRHSKTIVLGVATLLLVAIGSTGMAWGRAKTYNRTPMLKFQRSQVYNRIPMLKYQNFLGNWNERDEPLLYALIRTPKEYDQLFHPAAIAGDPRPFHPEAGLYEKSQILVVARVLSIHADLSKADEFFEVEQVTAEDRELTLRYRLKRPEPDVSDPQFKVFLSIRVPRANYRKVTIVEDGKLVGQLKPGEGLWTVPKPASE